MLRPSDCTFDRRRCRLLSPLATKPKLGRAGVGERRSWLALAPVVLTGVFYLLPSSLQHIRLIQFLPQLSAYLALGLWLACNTGSVERLGANPSGMAAGIRWGMATGVVLGGVNTFVILWLVPSFGGDILFLKEAPHARMPTWVMAPWGILAIAVGVELNFRGFLLGRLVVLVRQWFPDAPRSSLNSGSILALTTSALVFAWDPFMVMTFRHLHWIAVWDGLIWGWIFIRLRNLYAVIIAHAVEVMMMYLSVKAALT